MSSDRWTNHGLRTGLAILWALPAAANTAKGLGQQDGSSRPDGGVLASGRGVDDSVPRIAAPDFQLDRSSSRPPCDERSIAGQGMPVQTSKASIPAGGCLDGSGNRIEPAKQERLQAIQRTEQAARNVHWPVDMSLNLDFARSLLPARKVLIVDSGDGSAGLGSEREVHTSIVDRPDPERPMPPHSSRPDASTEPGKGDRA